MKEAPADQQEPLVMFTIYEHPADHPKAFVCRRWFCFPGEDVPRADVKPWYIDLTLEAVRKQVPPGLVCLSRMEGDDPVIVETWL